MKTAIAPCLISLLLAAGCTAREEPVQAAGSETAPAPAVTPPARTLEGKAIEDYGAVGDYTGAEFYNALTIIPLGGEGDGTSKVIYTGGGDVFDAGWVGRELVVFRCHHNPGAYPETRNYFPNLLTCRYVKVVKVIDARTLEVDLSINGVNPDFKPDGVTPSMTGASGYFFTNTREAFRKAFTDPERPEALLLENGRTYVVRGGWDCAVPKNLVVTTRDPGGPKAAIKLSFEDAFSTDPHGQGAGRCPSFAADYGSAAYFRLEDGEDYSIAFRNIDLLPPHYTVPLTQYGNGLDGALFAAPSKQTAQRVLEVVDSDCFREADAIDRSRLPPGLTFVLPQFAYSNGGGRAGEVDFGGTLGRRPEVVGFQEFRLIRSHWQSSQVHNIKQQAEAAGNCFIAEGESPERPARLLSSTDIIVAGEDGMGQFRIPVTITDHEGDGVYRRVNLHTDSFSWYQLANQYWVGGALNSAFSIYLEASDPTDTGTTCRVYFGTPRELAREAGFTSWNQWSTRGLLDGFTAEIAERIPKTGGTLAIDAPGQGMNIKLSDTDFRVFGWALQTGDRLEHGGRTYTVAAVERRFDWGRADNPSTYGPGYGGEVDYGPVMCLDVTLDAPVAEAAPAFRIASSKLDYLLSGRHEVRIVNTRVIGNYFCYSDFNTNVRMKNCVVRGVFRATSTYGDNANDQDNLARQTKYLEFVNVRYDGDEVYNQLTGNRSLMDRARITGEPHRVLIDGGHFYWTGPNVELRNRPTLIYGTASYGEPRLVNPLLDGQGVVVDNGLSVQLRDGFVCDLSNTTVSEHADPGISVCGEGTLKVDNLRFGTSQAALVIVRAGGFDPTVPNRLKIVGRGGEGGIRVMMDLGAEGPHCSITLTDWTLRSAPFVGGEWQGVKGALARGAIPAENITVNGLHPQ